MINVFTNTLYAFRSVFGANESVYNSKTFYHIGYLPKFLYFFIIFLSDPLGALDEIHLLRREAGWGGGGGGQTDICLT